MKTVMKFEAFDGTVFDDRKECERHEREHARTRIVGLTAEQIAGAFNPTTDDDHGLAAALEDIGVVLRAARLARGDKRSIDGTHHHVSRKHLHLYTAELDFKYNTRKVTDGERTAQGIRRIEGKRLMMHRPKGSK